MELSNRCSFCGKSLARGVSFWHTKIQLWANVDTDFGPSPPSDTQIDNEYQRILERIKYVDEDTLEKEIYQSFDFKLCRDCRDRFTANPLNKPLDYPEQ